MSACSRPAACSRRRPARASRGVPGGRLVLPVLLGRPFLRLGRGLGILGVGLGSGCPPSPQPWRGLGGRIALGGVVLGGLGRPARRRHRGAGLTRGTPTLTATGSGLLSSTGVRLGVGGGVVEGLGGTVGLAAMGAKQLRSIHSCANRTRLQHRFPWPALAAQAAPWSTATRAGRSKRAARCRVPGAEAAAGAVASAVAVLSDVTAFGRSPAPFALSAVKRSVSVTDFLSFPRSSGGARVPSGRCAFS